MRKAELLPTRDCEAGCGPVHELKNSIKIKVGQGVLELLIQNQHFYCFDL